MNTDEFITINDDGVVFKAIPDSCIGLLFSGTRQYLLEIKMPCGNELSLDLTKQAIPSEDTPCPCGDPKHWLVKYE